MRNSNEISSFHRAAALGFLGSLYGAFELSKLVNKEVMGLVTFAYGTGAAGATSLERVAGLFKDGKAGNIAVKDVFLAALSSTFAVVCATAAPEVVKTAATATGFSGPVIGTIGLASLAAGYLQTSGYFLRQAAAVEQAR